MNSFWFRRLIPLCGCILAVFSLLLSGPVFSSSAEAAEVLHVSAGDGVSFYSYSTRLDLKRSFYLMNINGGTRPYSFSLTRPIVTIEPSYPGAQVSFKVIPKAVGTTVLTIKDTKGNSLIREIIVYEPGVQPLALGALPGASNPVAVGQGRGFGVSGGKTPYTVVSANPGIARVEARTNLFMIWGVAAGTTQVTVTDAAGAKAQGTVHVGTTKPLIISADATILSGGKGELVISSGNPPYTVTTSPQLLPVFKGNDSHGRPVYTLTARSTGQGGVTVRDGKGQTATKTVMVKEWVSLSFPGLTGEPRTLDVGQTTPLSVSGGKAPYTVRASLPNAVSIQQQGTGQYLVTGRQAGVVGITARDSNGVSREMSLIVRNLPTLTLSAPATLTVGTPGRLTLIGGASPFTVSASGSQLTITDMGNKTYRLTPNTPGNVTITVKDAKGTSKQHNVAIAAPVQPLKLYVSSNTLQLDARGAAAIRALSIQGGVAPYTATVSGNQLSLTQVNANQYQMTPRAKGTATITVRDRMGRIATQTMTVQ